MSSTQPYLIADLSYEPSPDSSRIIFASNDKVDFIAYELKDPYRIVIDPIGVSFCELEEHIDYQQGLVKSIDIIKTPYAQKPEGLDEYFYAVDYIIITPSSEKPYRVMTDTEGKIVLIEIGEEKQQIIKEEQESIEPAEGYTLSTAPDEPKEQAEEKPAAPAEEKRPQAPLNENIIDYISCESIEDSSLAVISTNKETDFEVIRRYYPDSDIILKPKGPVYTDLEEEVLLKEGFIGSLKIVKDSEAVLPPALDQYFYRVKYIIIKPTTDLPYDFYANEDATISILEIYYPQKQLDMQEKKEEKPKPIPLEVSPETRREIVKKLKQEIKSEGLLREEKLIQMRKEEEEQRKQDAAKASQQLEREILRDLLVRGKGILDLKVAQQAAADNNPQARTQKEEIKLANMKKKEAFRALFPQVKIKASHTTGSLYEDPNAFTEEVYGVEAEHPLYQGGRLWNTFKQNKVNVKVAKARYQKIINDLDYKVAEAYFNIVTAIMNTRLQRTLLKDTEEIVKLAQKRRDAGLSTDFEILNVKAQYNQVQFQLVSAERDLALARFKLEQAINFDIAKDQQKKEINLDEVDTELQFKILDVDLYKCLDMAYRNQPDILVNKLLVESSEYGKKIARGKDNFKVDITGFYGQGDSYYNTESKNLESNWNIGLKVSKPLGGNTASYSFTKDKTSLEIGQSTRTGTTVNSGEFAILDSMGIASEIKEAKINKMKAENDLVESRRQIALEVKEAYYAYQEAIIQVKNSLEKVKFQEEAVKVAKAQAELNEALQSQLLEAMVKLADERSVYIKALSDYNLSLYRINKAIGAKYYFKAD